MAAFDPPKDPTMVRLVVDSAIGLPPALDDAGLCDGAAPKPSGGLPADFPVIPLGRSVEIDGLYCHYLDSANHIRSIRDRDHTRLVLCGLVGERVDLLEKYWPRQKWLGAGSRGGRTTKDVAGAWVTTGFAPDEMAKALMAAAAAVGDIDMFEAVREIGAWRGADGELIMHFGDRVLVGSQWYHPGRIGDYIYPGGPTQPKPAAIMAAAVQRDLPAERLGILRTWNWQRPELDPVLVLGWIAAAMIGGALDWRPSLWITGDLSTGKSTLLERPVARGYPGFCAARQFASVALGIF